MKMCNLYQSHFKFSLEFLKIENFLLTCVLSILQGNSHLESDLADVDKQTIYNTELSKQLEQELENLRGRLDIFYLCIRSILVCKLYKCLLCFFNCGTKPEKRNRKISEKNVPVVPKYSSTRINSIWTDFNHKILISEVIVDSTFLKHWSCYSKLSTGN